MRITPSILLVAVAAALSVAVGDGLAVGLGDGDGLGSKLPVDVIDSAGDGAKATSASCVQLTMGTSSSEPSSE